VNASRPLRTARVAACRAICFLAGLACLVFPVLAEETGVGADSSADKFADEPAAHRLYDRMIEAMREAKSLSYLSHYQREAVGKFNTACTYRVWLKKPNSFRMETQTVSGQQGGVLIGDGKSLWIHWPSGRPHWEYVNETAADELTRFRSYMTKPTPQGKHSIWHEAIFLGAGMSYPILEASAFHGRIASLESHSDGVRSLGTQTIGGEDCEQIEVSLLDHQRSWNLWLSKQDHLPRKLKETTRVTYDVVTREEWSAVTVNGDIPDSMFAWQPPAGWTEWKLPDDEDGLLKPGSRAPDFDLTSIGGERIRLSDFRGKPVWLCFWRVGCTPCRREMPFLQEFYTKTKDKGLVILAVNVSDDKTITVDYLRKQGITFPTILDNSEVAEKTSQAYGGGAVPMNYLIDADGVVVDAFFDDQGHARAKTALEKLAPDLAKSIP
jgi:peroxiredoxin/outer membrane lipoprotein-sorting protein